jgi:hypothetical protein
VSAEAKRGPAPTRRVALRKLGKPENMGGDALVNWWKPGDELPEALFQERTDDKGKRLRPEADGWREGVHYQTVPAA